MLCIPDAYLCLLPVANTQIGLRVVNRVARFKGYFRIGYSQSNILMRITMPFPMM